MNQKRKGDNRERELVNMLDDDDFAIMRAPASGGGTQRELPDVLAGNARDFYAIEAKSSSDNPIYVSLREIADLIYFALKFGAKPRIGARFDREEWYFFHPSELHCTNSYSRRVKKDDLSDGCSYSDFVSD